ncbi:hypothetical protein ACSLBF_12005 [Pseudoalteromonas sp. T1lg65]|uniref:hypothetical protein n=1 Tax=Pseudoalteromonas sp. T1lg65 TaxID=2077101 RepID=UPI003F7A6D3A
MPFSSWQKVIDELLKQSPSPYSILRYNRPRVGDSSRPKTSQTAEVVTQDTWLGKP